MNNNQLNIRTISKSELQEIAEIVVDKYLEIYGENQDQQPLRVKDMLISIFVAQDQSAHWQQQVRDEAKLSLRAENEHLMHLEESELDAISRRDLKIVSRLIDLKNEKQSKLEHMMVKYDLLLEKVRQMRQNQTRLQTQINTLKEENNRHLAEITRLTTENKKLELNLKKATENLERFEEEAKNSKLLFDEMKLMIAKTYSQMESKFAQTIELLIGKYTTFIDGLKTELGVTLRRQDMTKKKMDDQILKMERTIKELVTDLGEAINFRQKENELYRDWLQQYRQMKLVKQRQEKIGIGRSNVEIHQGSSETEKFINAQKELLRRFQVRPQPVQR